MDKQHIIDNAPEIPSNTCPYIDFVIQVIEEIAEEVEGDKSNLFLNKKIDIIKVHLEHLRDCNDNLRQSSRYWRREWENKGKKR